MPDVAAGLAAAIFTALGVLMSLFGLIGSKPTGVTRSTSTAVKGKTARAVPVSTGGEEKKALEDAGVEVPSATGAGATASAVEDEGAAVKKRPARGKKVDEE